MNNPLNNKRARGRFYTRGNPFTLPAFQNWASRANLPKAHLLEPFAGAGHIIRALTQINLCNKFSAFDIAPNPHPPIPIHRADTIAQFPQGYPVCVTNPPWLARNSATRRALPYPRTPYDDLYKHCLALCLQNCPYVAALLPASFLQSGQLRDRLTAYILLHDTLFTDTENPVCLALFEPKPTPKENKTNSEIAIHIHYDHQYIGDLHHLQTHLPPKATNPTIRFNDTRGHLGFISFDNTRAPSIAFCPADHPKLRQANIKPTSRFLTRISGDFTVTENLIHHLNTRLATFRTATNDLFLTPFKGIRADGNYRRRMDFALARRFIGAYSN